MKMYHYELLKKAGRGHSSEAILIVHGYMNDTSTPRDYFVWTESIRDAGWHGNIYGLHWDSGGIFDCVNALINILITLSIPNPIGIPGKLMKVGRVALAIKRLKNHWREACENADLVGQELGFELAHLKPSWAQHKLWLIGHSLGTRVVYKALCEAGKEGRPVVNRVLLYGGALSTSFRWPPALKAVRFSVNSYYSIFDKVLYRIYFAAELENPIGILPIRSRSRKIHNIDVYDLIDGYRDHFAYHKVLERRGFK